MKTLFLTSIMLLFLAGCAFDQPKPEDMRTESFVISQSFVKARLKSPSTAAFPTDSYTAYYSGNNTWEVRSVVDAQNSFGAQIRQKYKVVIKYKSGEWSDAGNWELISAEIY